MLTHRRIPGNLRNFLRPCPAEETKEPTYMIIVIHLQILLLAGVFTEIPDIIRDLHRPDLIEGPVVLERPQYLDGNMECTDEMWTICQTVHFDLRLKSTWEQKQGSNVFRNDYKETEMRHIPGIYRFLAEFNMNRARLKREPTHVSSIQMPFDESNFHFEKVNPDEVLFQIKPSHWDRKECDEDFLMCKTLIIANASPLNYGSSLLIPGIEMHSPQVLTNDALRIAVETVLISHDPSLRIGFNSLGAFSSVNHLHFHVYYLEESLYLQHAPVKKLAGKCYETMDYPAKAFVFEVTKIDKVLPVVKSVMKIIDLLIDLKIAHNVFITRGTSCETSVPEGEEIFDAVRIYVWPRRSFFGLKYNETFNPAVCEFAGHVLMKYKQHFERVDEEGVANFMRGWTHNSFIIARDHVLKHKFV